MKIRLAIIAFALVVSGCGLTKGIVVAKHDYPAHYSTYMQPVYGQDCHMVTRSSYDSVSKSTRYTTTQQCDQVVRYYQPVQQWHAESWTLTIRGLEHEDQTAELDVDRGIYERAQAGDLYDDQTKEVEPQ